MIQVQSICSPQFAIGLVYLSQLKNWGKYNKLSGFYNLALYLNSYQSHTISLL